MSREFVLRLRVSRPAARILLGILLLGFPYGTLTPAPTVVVPYDLTLSGTMPEPAGAFATLTAGGKTFLATTPSGATSQAGQNNVLIGSGQSCGRPDPGNYVASPGTGIAIRGYILHNALPSGCPGNALGQNIHRVHVQSNVNFAMLPDDITAPDRAKLVVAGDIRASRLIWGRPGDPGALNVREWPFELGDLKVTLCYNPVVDPNTGNVTCSVAYNRDPNADHVHMSWTVYNSTGFGGTDRTFAQGGSGLYFPGVGGYYRTWIQRCGNASCSSIAWQQEIKTYPQQPPERMDASCAPGYSQACDNSLTPNNPNPPTYPTGPGAGIVLLPSGYHWVDGGTGVRVRCRYVKEDHPYPINLNGDCFLSFPSGVTGTFPYSLKVSQCCRPSNPSCGLGC